jgi:hypothetical protein
VVSVDCYVVKVKLSLVLIKHHGMKTWGSGCIAPLFLDFGTRCRGVVSLMPWPVYPWGKDPQYPSDRKLGGP